jgi:hypothetical protein
MQHSTALLLIQLVPVLVAVGLFLVDPIIRYVKQEMLGTVLLDLGPGPDARSALGTGILCLILCGVVIWYLGFDSGSSVLALFAVNMLAETRLHQQMRKKGISTESGVLRWNQIVECEWLRQNVLSITPLPGVLKPRLLSLRPSPLVTWQVPAEQRDLAERILREHLPDPFWETESTP